MKNSGVKKNSWQNCKIYFENKIPEYTQVIVSSNLRGISFLDEI